ncbi:putative indole-3-pyruvate monooxygenase [Helianthus annuus]|uniref:indole-3-pyruvate monooxygenase n=1 Tax=Helianthus annuus TaxID=4232 RepID=A0A251V095_HELAN|nr:probable indole-3-pyruvate monooxygenase YUCCA10 [Helianthus annuus]KAF5811146.1 putative indole-3-pyruvate monooxygenase [Helianthus annuus]KAJ0589927.1 putative indole-3-pyruvate monooxygenase [Helianthus annuus]KAJ0597819.1 putative indole-3-pyruvate monooxygenase [Helianthus annuus]KAJ0758460.1 putative indole-3-pyruvate monooxygenase [Helianthus annuus]KAJ0762119.1 putative indole-3-pyruvate monooxygenase [Helianthus annuus]
MKQETVVVIVGAGPAGIATSACLNLLSIPNIVLEREDCYASLWQKKAYDRLKLHLAKNFCELPHMPFPLSTPTFVPKNMFVKYLKNYVYHFNVDPLYQRSVESACYDKRAQKWVVTAKNSVSGLVEEYVSEFLVVATGENSEGFIPNVYGLDTFKGLVIHSIEYENGKKFGDKDVLVVGAGNSGMEIAYDLCNWGAQTTVVVRSPTHVLTKDLVQLGMYLLKYIPCTFVDKMVLMLSKLLYGDLGSYGIQRPLKGPFLLKKETGRSPVIDVGTISKIRTGDIEVMPAIKDIQGDRINFTNDQERQFDAIVFATGFKSTVQKWLKDDGGLFNEKGMPKYKSPNHWKGENGLYCVGFASAGLFGISNDAKNIANDISRIMDNGN